MRWLSSFQSLERCYCDIARLGLSFCGIKYRTLALLQLQKTWGTHTSFTLHNDTRKIVYSSRELQMNGVPCLIDCTLEEIGRGTPLSLWSSLWLDAPFTSFASRSRCRETTSSGRVIRYVWLRESHKNQHILHNMHMMFCATCI